MGIDDTRNSTGFRLGLGVGDQVGQIPALDVFPVPLRTLAIPAAVKANNAHKKNINPKTIILPQSTFLNHGARDQAPVVPSSSYSVTEQAPSQRSSSNGLSRQISTRLESTSSKAISDTEFSTMRSADSWDGLDSSDGEFSDGDSRLPLPSRLSFELLDS